MKELNDFVTKYDYTLKNCLEYNSYRDWSRNYVRKYDSVSVTEILSLIEDKNLKFLYSYYKEWMDRAMKFWTSKHKDFEDYFKSKSLNSSDNIDVNFRKFLIDKDCKIKKSEKTYKKKYWKLPVITWDIDNISIINKQYYIIDYKISKTRNFKSKKYNIQLAWYRWLSDIKKSWILYLNDKWYKFVENNDEIYDKIWLDLLEYANNLFINNKTNNLFIK